MGKLIVDKEKQRANEGDLIDLNDASTPRLAYFSKHASSRILQKGASSSQVNAVMLTCESYTESDFIQTEFY